MYRASFGRLPSAGVEMCSLEHAGPLPAPWLAPGFVVNLVVGGSADLVARGSSHRVGPGSVVLADAGELRSVSRRHSKSAKTRSLTFAEDRLRAAIEERGSSTRAALHFGSNVTTSLTTVIVALYRAIDERAPRLSIEGALEGVLDGVARELSQGGRRRWPRHPRIRRAEAMLRDRFRDDLSLDELADEVSLSRTHLLRQFRAELGLPPHAYLIQLRVAHARGLLARGMSPAEVSATCGFFDQSHFARHFRRLVGLAPGAYARCHALPGTVLSYKTGSDGHF